MNDPSETESGGWVCANERTVKWDKEQSAYLRQKLASVNGGPTLTTNDTADDLAAFADLLAWRDGYRVWELTGEANGNVTLRLTDVDTGHLTVVRGRPTVRAAVRDALAAWGKSDAGL